MRLKPIEKPRGVAMRLAYRASRKRLGKAITPLKVVYARVPTSLRLGYQITKFMERGLTVDERVRLLVQIHVANLNGCGFCIDIAKAHAMQGIVEMDTVEALPDYATSPRFTTAERAALAYAEEATVNKRVSDATFAELKRHFNEREIVELTLVGAIENFYNLVNLPLEIESDGLCALAARRDGARETGAVAKA